MGSVGFGSLGPSGSGIDVQAFVEQVLFVERAPVRLWETQRTKLDAQAAAIRDINSKLGALQDAVNALRDLAGQFNSKLAKSSSADVLTAAADTTATAATHQIAVSSLATTSSYYSSQLADESTAFGTGSFDLQIGSGAPTTITVDGTNNTLDGIAAHINGLDLGVAASVITDANGARLSLVGKISGSPGDLTISNNTSGLTFTKAVTGTNASLTVNGVPVTSSTNSVSSVVAGVTFELLSISATTVTVTVKPDPGKAREAVDEFVTTYNAVVQSINAQFTYNSATNSAPPLFGDSSLRILQERVLTSATYSITGNDDFVNLGTIGINMLDDGTLSVDGTKFNSAFASNFANVQALFQSTSPAGIGQNFASTLDSLTDSIDGLLNVSLKGISESQNSLTQQISAFNVRLEYRRTALNEQFSRVDGLLRELPTLLAQIQNQLATLPK